MKHKGFMQAMGMSESEIDKEILGIMPATNQPTWVSVQDRLPERNKKVIGYFPSGDESGENVAPAHICASTGELVSSASNSTASFYVATHWMYYPYPPFV